MGSVLRKLLMIVLLFGLIAGVAVNTMAAPDASPKESAHASETAGKVKQDGRGLKNTTLLIQSKGSATVSYHVNTDEGGNLRSSLPDGEYTIKGFEEDGVWYSTHESFSVIQGKVSGGKNGEINVKGKAVIKEKQSKQKHNVKGTLSEGSKALQGEIIVASMNEEYEEIFFLPAKGNGNFSAYLPDGQYYIYGVALKNEFYNYEQFFYVNGNELVIDGETVASLDISIPEKLHKGKVTDSLKPFADAEIVLERIIEEDYYYEYIQYVKANKRGEFSLRALPDGDYSLSIFSGTFSSWDEMKFQVADGKLFLDGEVTSLLNLKVPDLSLKGTVLDGKKGAGHVYLEIEKLSEDGYPEDYFWVAADQKGNFSYRLKDGRYNVSSVEEEMRTTSVNVSFEVRDGHMFQNGAKVKTLNITLPPVTLTGTLTDGEIIHQGYVEIEHVSDEEWTWYFAATDESGKFSLRLTDGEYKVSWAYLFEDGDSVPLSLHFEMRNGKLNVDGVEKKTLEVIIPPVTLHGILLDNGEPAEGEVFVTSADGELYFWKWVNEDGTFSMRLADGKYILNNVYLYDGTEAYINTEFEIHNGQLYVNGKLSDRLEVNVPPVTVTGKLLEDGVPVQGHITVNSADEHMLNYWAGTNEDGEFFFRLPDGEYAATYVYLYDDSSFTTGQYFTVEGGKLFIDGEAADSLDIEVPPVTLSGTVYSKNKPVRDGYVAVAALDEEGEPFTWHENWISDNGKYVFRLPDGSYLLEYADAFTGEVVYFDKQFFISEGKLFVDGEETDSLNLHLDTGKTTP